MKLQSIKVFSPGLLFLFFLSPFKMEVFSGNVASIKDLVKTREINKINILTELGEEICARNSDSTIEISRQALTLAQNVGYKEGAAKAYYNLGVAYWRKEENKRAADFFNKTLLLTTELEKKFNENPETDILLCQAKARSGLGMVYENQGDYSLALENEQEAVKELEETLLKIETEKNEKSIRKAETAIARTFGNIGVIYRDIGKYSLALDHYFKALSLNEKCKDKNEMARTFSNIGVVYELLADYQHALDYYIKALFLARKVNSKRGVATILGNMGNIFINQGDKTKGLKYYNEALQAMEEIGDKSGIAINLQNIAGLNFENKQYDKALENFLKVFQIYRELNDKEGMISSTAGIGDAYLGREKFRTAYNYYMEALNMAKQIGALPDVRNICRSLSTLYAHSTVPLPDTTLGKTLGTEKMRLLALFYYKQFILFRDSIDNEQVHKTAQQKELQHEFEKKEAVHQQQIALAKAENKRQRLFLALIAAIAFAITGVAFVIFRSLRISRLQQAIIAEKQKEIIDSITYSKRLQEAFLPPKSLISNECSDFFIYYQPKDIVAGDFYWAEKKGDHFFIAAADCTGHGVPGAMVSVVCGNALNRAVKEFHLTSPSEILDKVRQLVIETFDRSEERVNDGMDISLLVYNRKTNQVQWGGANRTLWYIQEGALQEVKGDKQPIGRYAEESNPFKTYQVENYNNVIFYLFTDGYADQFGGNNGKKMMTANFKALLLNIYSKPLHEQQSLVKTHLETWKGKEAQTDDILVIGLKI